MRPLQIHEAFGDRADTIAAIIRASHRDVAVRFGLTRDNCPKHPSHCSTDSIHLDLDRGVRYWILEREGVPAGCVAVEAATPEVCYIERLSVLPEHRRNGLGTLLMGHAIDVARAMGARGISIGIIAAYTELRRWYATMGFIEGETKIFDHLPFQVLMMVLSLNGSVTRPA